MCWRHREVNCGSWSGDPLLVDVARAITGLLRPSGSIPNFDNYLADEVVAHLGGEVIERAPCRFDPTLGTP